MWESNSLLELFEPQTHFESQDFLSRCCLLLKIKLWLCWTHLVCPYLETYEYGVLLLMRVCWAPHCWDFIRIDTQSNDHYKHQWRHTAYTRSLKIYFKKNSNIYIACIQLTPPNKVSRRCRRWKLRPFGSSAASPTTGSRCKPTRPKWKKGLRAWVWLWI